ncbi:hypothetical protein P7K49_027198 [Saguinus oedipus]|uniref:Uncharacterized protein n=1 Tax=Saguinus oedipus TaxID=9490 RepID=A0ABQ9UHN3_SAGOE|nr:hypothetical protein P7K49_027198 [Saguinus oedipus]
MEENYLIALKVPGVGETRDAQPANAAGSHRLFGRRHSGTQRGTHWSGCPVKLAI